MFTDSLKRMLNKRSLKKQPKPIKRKSSDLKSAKWVGILFDATSEEGTKSVLTYKEKLEKQGKKIQLLGYVNSRSKEIELDFPFFSKQHINWKDIPKNEAIEDFLTRTFDVLLVLHPQTKLVFEYLTSLADARLKVGPYTSDTKSYDLMVQVNKDMPISEFTKQSESYANIVKSYAVQKSTKVEKKLAVSMGN